MTMNHLGFIPSFLSESDPGTAAEQFARNYVSGWTPMGGFKLAANNVLSYPGDPPMPPLAETRLRDELIVFYEYAFVAIIQPDRAFEVARMD